jgi:ribonuclease J
MSELTRKLQHICSKHKEFVNEGDKRMKELLESDRIHIFEADKFFFFGPFQILPLSVDHSAFDAFSFIFNVDHFKLYHTGDFRTHGFRSSKWEQMIKNRIKEPIDCIVCEATCIARPDQKLMTEHELQTEFRKNFSSHKYNVVYVSSSNIDRIFSIIHAANGRWLYMDSYQKEIIDTVCNSNFVYSRSDLYKIGKEHIETLQTSSGSFIVCSNFKERLNQCGYILFARSGERYDNLIAKLPGKKQVYLSMWDGYITERHPCYNKQLAKSVGADYMYLHTSGHCDMKSLERLFELTRPRKVIAIHTDDNEAFTKLFGQRWNVVPMQDGQTETLIHI